MPGGAVLSEQKCIMVVGAHAADAEIMAGATVLKHVEAGWRAVLVHLTLGEKGHPRSSGRRLTRRRALWAPSA
jgi:LmbE family N-acetylglucosaminyl deacetylase